MKSFSSTKLPPADQIPILLTLRSTLTSLTSTSLFWNLRIIIRITKIRIIAIRTTKTKENNVNDARSKERSRRNTPPIHTTSCERRRGVEEDINININNKKEEDSENPTDDVSKSDNSQ